MYMWHETIAKRGSSKVASCLRHSTQTYQTGTKSLVFFSSVGTMNFIKKGYLISVAINSQLEDTPSLGMIPTSPNLKK